MHTSGVCRGNPHLRASPVDCIAVVKANCSYSVHGVREQRNPHLRVAPEEGRSEDLNIHGVSEQRNPHLCASPEGGGSEGAAGPAQQHLARGPPALHPQTQTNASPYV